MCLYDQTETDNLKQRESYRGMSHLNKLQRGTLSLLIKVEGMDTFTEDTIKAEGRQPSRNRKQSRTLRTGTSDEQKAPISRRSRHIRLLTPN